MEIRGKRLVGDTLKQGEERRKKCSECVITSVSEEYREEEKKEGTKK